MDERKHFLEMNEITDDNKDTLKGANTNAEAE